MECTSVVLSRVGLCRADLASLLAVGNVPPCYCDSSCSACVRWDCRCAEQRSAMPSARREWRQRFRAANVCVQRVRGAPSSPAMARRRFVRYGRLHFRYKHYSHARPACQITRAGRAPLAQVWKAVVVQYSVPVPGSQPSAFCATKPPSGGSNLGCSSSTDLVTNSQCDKRTENLPGRTYDPPTTERLARSPPTKANQVQSPAGSPDFRKWESCRTIPLVGGFLRGFTFPPPLQSGAAPYSLPSLSSALKTLMLRAAQLSSLTLSSSHLHTKDEVDRPRWLRTTILRDRTLNGYSADTASKNDVYRIRGLSFEMFLYFPRRPTGQAAACVSQTIRELVYDRLRTVSAACPSVVAPAGPFIRPVRSMQEKGMVCIYKKKSNYVFRYPLRRNTGTNINSTPILHFFNMWRADEISDVNAAGSQSGKSHFPLEPDTKVFVSRRPPGCLAVRITYLREWELHVDDWLAFPPNTVAKQQLLHHRSGETLGFCNCLSQSVIAITLVPWVQSENIQATENLKVYGVCSNCLIQNPHLVLTEVGNLRNPFKRCIGQTSCLQLRRTEFALGVIDGFPYSGNVCGYAGTRYKCAIASTYRALNWQEQWLSKLQFCNPCCNKRPLLHSRFSISFKGVREEDGELGRVYRARSCDDWSEVVPCRPNSTLENSSAAATPTGHQLRRDLGRMEGKICVILPPEMTLLITATESVTPVGTGGWQGVRARYVPPREGQEGGKVCEPGMCLPVRNRRVARYVPPHEGQKGGKALEPVMCLPVRDRSVARPRARYVSPSEGQEGVKALELGMCLPMKCRRVASARARYVPPCEGQEGGKACDPGICLPVRYRRVARARARYVPPHEGQEGDKALEPVSDECMGIADAVVIANAFTSGRHYHACVFSPKDYSWSALDTLSPSTSDLNIADHSTQASRVWTAPAVVDTRALSPRATPILDVYNAGLSRFHVRSVVHADVVWGILRALPFPHLVSPLPFFRAGGNERQGKKKESPGENSIPGNSGKPKSGWLDREANPGRAEWEASGLPLCYLAHIFYLLPRINSVFCTPNSPLVLASIGLKELWLQLANARLHQHLPLSEI
ncbi:hypothetical protein PR048_029154 [Dryococelus australis]|uniref:Uncharacterized protein n=1 Tax=Dryococelus australis TaxID=614101 RepID=A0ABQ9GCJ7_9NEOP|nr:hypothetical protein PR048_029154 [Dryococelus australis]